MNWFWICCIEIFISMS